MDYDDTDSLNGCRGWMNACLLCLVLAILLIGVIALWRML